ncbi:MAG TPA: glycosyltransferase family 2 protein, partial [Acidimicrobiales bacterium]|nr:glycosyltransferase family 2 protein [Acidimicrobiales bacterium]
MDACDRLDDPIATVVVATRDRPQDLSHCLDRLDGLPEQPPVIVVDNGSAVSPAPVCADRPEVTLVPLPGNLGAAARNVGARLASTEVVAFCDDDSWWEPGALATATRFLNEHRQAGLAVARVLVEPSGDLDPVSACIGAGPFDIEWRRRPGGHRAVAGFLACSAAVRRDAFLAVGGFPDELVIGGEETPLALRLAAAGWHLGYVPEAVV